MKSFHTIFTAFSFVLLFVACEKDSPEDSDSLDSQPIYFEYIYKNWAWGYQHTGWVIDNKGQVNYYNLPDDWQYADKNGYMSMTDMIKNLAQTDSVKYKIDIDELKRKVGLIIEAKDGEITEPVQRAYDAGASTLVAYYYDSKKMMFKQVFLGQSGDYESHNTSLAAMELVVWLKQFGVFWLD